MIVLALFDLNPCFFKTGDVPEWMLFCLLRSKLAFSSLLPIVFFLKEGATDLARDIEERVGL
jgi:hypothetical protein